jgi:hypothetical protein
LPSEDGVGSLIIYPNPSASQLNIVLPDAQWEKPLLFDAVGRLQAADWMQTEAGRYRLNTQGLAGGIYYVRSQSKNKIAQGKALILK